MYPFKTCALSALLLLTITATTSLRAEMSLYIVAPGDTLWSIANENMKSPDDWQRLMEFNNISDKSQLKVDQELRIPMDWLKSSFDPVTEANRPANLPAVALTPARDGNATTNTPDREGAKSVKTLPAALGSDHIVAATYGVVEKVNGNNRTTLLPDNLLKENDRVTTGKVSSVNLRLKDGSTVVLLSESEVELSQPFKLLRGSIEYHANNNNEQKLISAATTEVSGKNTYFRLTTLKNETQIRLEVEQGFTTVSANNTERTISAGLAIIVESGKSLPEPRQGIMRPDVTNLSKRSVNGQVSLEWPAISDAAGYRAQLVFAADTYLVLLDEVVNQPKLIWKNISPGLYKIRLRSVDNKGAEGINAELPFMVQGALEAPQSNAPVDGATLPNNTPWIAWSRVSEANSYTLQVAKDPAFKTGLQEYSYLVNNYFKYSDALTSGNYYWRVMSVSPRQVKSTFGEVRMFKIK